MIIDFNAHYGREIGTTAGCGVEELSRIEKSAGVDKIIASAFGGESNNQPFPGNMIRFIPIDPAFDKDQLDLEPFIKGIRIYPTYHPWDFDSPAMADLLSLAREKSSIIQVYLRLQDPRAMPPAVPSATVIEALDSIIPVNSDIRFVISGATYLEIAANPAPFRYNNAWIEISHVQHPINSLPKLLDIIDSSRVLYGSGAPVLYPYVGIFRILNSPISQDIQERILTRNAIDLLGGI